MSKVKVLVVEDESIVAQDIQQSLERLGYCVPAITASGEEAVEEAVKIRPDLALMDIRLQGAMDGVEAARQLSTILSIPVIYLTAYGDESTLERAKVTEPFGYILKPFKERDLHTTIEIALYKHRMERKLKEHDLWLDAILKSISNGVATTDTKGLVTSMNPVAEALSAWSQKDAIGRDVAEVFYIFNEETRTLVGSAVLEAIQKGMVFKGQNHTILLTRNDKEIPIDITAGPIRDDQGNIQGTVLVFRDITKQQQAVELRVLAAKLEQRHPELRGLSDEF